MKRATRRKDWQPLLDAFRPEVKSKFALANPACVRLPSWERLLQIDAEAERAAQKALKRSNDTPLAGC